ncbi:6814_t:CDS:2 [Scutellospora calospora]|uniref:6814_t:CDS:1 n=1 Tax=Scutellospora calospora TaxID=85575 RepID=A0ACA9KP98_9GLOM|nr:6814_t:CDS:2 [Scutellospora calospora]
MKSLLYLAFVIWSYSRKIQTETHDERFNDEEATPSYGSIQIETHGELLNDEEATHSYSSIQN